MDIETYRRETGITGTVDGHELQSYILLRDLDEREEEQ